MTPRMVPNICTNKVTCHGVPPCLSQMFVTYITEGQVTFPLLLPQPPLITEGQVTFPRYAATSPDYGRTT